MKTEDVAAIATVTAVAAGIGLVVQSVKGTDYYCPPPSAASVATLLAPCQALDTALGHKVTRKEAMQMGLLAPDERSTQPATRLAGGSDASEWINPEINPKTVSTSMQLSVGRTMGFTGRS